MNNLNTKKYRPRNTMTRLPYEENRKIKARKKTDAAKTAKKSCSTEKYTTGGSKEENRDVQTESADMVASMAKSVSGNNRTVIENGIRKKTSVQQYLIRKRNTVYRPKKKSSSALKNKVKPLKKGGNAINTSARTANRAVKAGKHSAQMFARANRIAAQAVKETARVVARVVKIIIDIMKEALKNTGELLMLTGAGEVVLVGVIVVFSVVIVIIAIVIIAYAYCMMSGNGLLSDDNSALLAAVAELNAEMDSKIDNIKNENEGQYDEMVLSGGSTIVTNWADILTVYAIKAQSEGIDITVVENEQMELLRNVYWGMNIVNTHNESDEEVRYLYIDIDSMSYLRYASITQMSEEDISSMEEMYEWAGSIIKRVTGTYTDIQLSQTDLETVLSGLSGVSEERREVVQNAHSLIGKVGYFWGGKSYVIGWDSRWGTSTLVTAGGDETSGTYQPYGLDCSGFVGWVFAQAFDGFRCTQGAANQYKNWCEPIPWYNAQPGDLVFFDDLSHVGVVAKKNGDGTLTVIHCSTAGGVVAGDYGQSRDAFWLVGRPDIFTD